MSERTVIPQKMRVQKRPYNNCCCDGCFDCTEVVDISMPVTMYHNGKQLTTKYTHYWLCGECATKLMHNLQEIDWGGEEHAEAD